MSRGRSATGRHACYFRSEILPPLRRESIDQRETVEAFAEPPREIVDPALPAQSAPLPDLLHCHPQDQDLMHQRGLRGQRWIDYFSRDRKSTRLNSSHQIISYAVLCLKKNTNAAYSIERSSRSAARCLIKETTARSTAPSAHVTALR